MARFQRSTWIDAPIEAVWTAHSTIDGLLAVTPSWLDLTVEELRDDSGDAIDPNERLGAGYEVDLSLTPIGVGPRQRWTSRIVAREDIADAGATDAPSVATAMFRDRMIRGPMAHWEHTHRFEAVEGGTRMTDRIEYRLPPGRVGAALSPLGRIGLEPAFWYRHRTTRRLFEAAPNDDAGE